MLRRTKAILHPPRHNDLISRGPRSVKSRDGEPGVGVEKGRCHDLIGVNNGRRFRVFEFEFHCFDSRPETKIVTYSRSKGVETKAILFAYPRKPRQVFAE